MPNFASILDQPASDVKPPPLLPVGTYHTVVVGLPETGQSSKKGTDFLKFTHKIVAPMDDVDEEELQTAFPDGVIGKTISNIFYLTDNSIFMLTDFIKNCGVELPKGKSIKACLDELPNSEVLVHIKHDPINDTGDRMIAKVGRTAPVE